MSAESQQVHVSSSKRASIRRVHAAKRSPNKTVAAATVSLLEYKESDRQQESDKSCRLNLTENRFCCSKLT